MEKTLLWKRTTGNWFSIPNLFYVGLYLVPLTHLIDEHGKNARVDQGLEGVDKRDASLSWGV